uniref:Protein kinase domain-containing protein n=1 Tax=Globisporangium ultimum (strain ATCC 200006 / CBS 805.95 / DAOM BR144) TaxID=431595 RepID=K3XBC0_GLOUD
MEALVEGQTLLHGGRYRFLRRIGTGTFAVILRAVDVQRGVAVAIKCMQHEEYNALGEQEADALQRFNEQDLHARCAIVRLFGTFVEHKRFCLVLEALGEPILNVACWGPWRQPYQERTLRSPASARRHKLISVAGRRSGTGATGDEDATTAALPIPICPSLPPLPLQEIRQIAVHLCGALAFLHEQGFIHADLKPENIVRNPIISSPQSSSTLSTVKLIDFGNCIDKHLLKLYAAQVEQQGGDAGFDVQTLAYRAPEVAAGLEISAAIDMWSLGCVLLECASGSPLFTTSPAIVLGDLEQNRGRETAWHEPTENQVILRQIEYLLNDGVALDSACSIYKDASCYNQKYNSKPSKRSRQQFENTSITKSPQVSRAHLPLSERLEAVASVSNPDSMHAQFHSFIRDLLAIDPSARMTAREALFHPFLQSFFPFRVLFRSPTAKPRSKTQDIVRTKRSRMFVTERSPASKQEHEQRLGGDAVFKQEIQQELSTEKRKKMPKQKVIRFSNGAPDHGKLAPNLRAALKLIPTTTPKTER